MPLGGPRTAVIASKGEEAAPAVIDNTTTHSQSSGANIWSFDHTMSADADLIIVGFGYQDNSGNDGVGAAVTIGGVSMSEVTDSLVSQTRPVVWFYLDKASAGANWPGSGTHEVSIDLPSTNFSTGGAIATSFEGAAQSEPPAWTSADSVGTTSLTTNTTCDAGSILEDVAVADDGDGITMTFGTDQVELLEVSLSPNTVTVGASRKASADVVADDSMSVTKDQSGDVEMGHSVVEIKGE